MPITKDLLNCFSLKKNTNRKLGCILVEEVFNLESESNLELIVEDINGRKMLERKINLSSAEKNHQLIWDAAKANAGIYFYKIKAGNEIATGKMIKM